MERKGPLKMTDLSDFDNIILSYQLARVQQSKVMCPDLTPILFLEIWSLGAFQVK